MPIRTENAICMKTMESLLLPGLVRIAGAIAAAFLFAACSKDPAAESALRGGYLRFEVTEADTWQTRSQSRAAEDSLQTEEVYRRFYVAGRNSRRHSVPARLGRRRNRRTAAECPNRPAADPCHTHRDGQFLRLVRRFGFGLYGLVERNLVSAGLYVQRRGDEGIVVDDLLPLAGQRAQYPLLRLRTLYGTGISLSSATKAGTPTLPIRSRKASAPSGICSSPPPPE